MYVCENLLHGQTQYKSDQASAKLDLSFNNVDMTNVKCQMSDCYNNICNVYMYVQTYYVHTCTCTYILHTTIAPGQSCPMSGF